MNVRRLLMFCHSARRSVASQCFTTSSTMSRERLWPSYVAAMSRCAPPPAAASPRRASKPPLGPSTLAPLGWLWGKRRLRRRGGGEVSSGSPTPPTPPPPAFTAAAAASMMVRTRPPSPSPPPPPAASSPRSVVGGEHVRLGGPGRAWRLRAAFTRSQARFELIRNPVVPAVFTNEVPPAAQEPVWRREMMLWRSSSSMFWLRATSAEPRRSELRCMARREARGEVCGWWRRWRFWGG